MPVSLTPPDFSRIEIDLSRIPTHALIERLTTYRMGLVAEDNPIVHCTYQLAIDEVIAEFARRNDLVIARREAGAQALVDQAMAIVGRRTS